MHCIVEESPCQLKHFFVSCLLLAARKKRSQKKKRSLKKKSPTSHFLKNWTDQMA